MSRAQYHRVTLETSIKPFSFDLTEQGIRSKAVELWNNWLNLVDRADKVAVMLWTGSGEEIMEWTGNWNDEICWGKSIGFCNFDTPGAFPQDNAHYRVHKAKLFVENPPRVTFAHQKMIVDAIKSVGKEMTGKDVVIGATIDPGPEFVDDDFRFKKHPEILTPEDEKLHEMMWFITHQCDMKADGEKYAAYPDGVPEGLPFGTFLGAQFKACREDFGYDFVWFSNGFAYTHFPWSVIGKVFDGETHRPELVAKEREMTNKFWQDFMDACPDAWIEVRGTNFSVGMDLMSQGCSHVDIANIGNLEVCAPNPPWGSQQLGLEMSSYLTRLSKTPGHAWNGRLAYRFYLNDPWFESTPWYDYYGREPFDIYVPLSVSRINDEGGVDVPNDLNLLSIDTEMGELLTGQALESTPHFIRALEERADEAGPVVWVYPFDEYDAMSKQQPEDLKYLFGQEWFVSRCFDWGFPATTVCSTDRFVALQKTGKLPASIFVVPAPLGDWEYTQALVDHVQGGGKVLLYGPLEKTPKVLLEMLGVTIADEALEGDFQLDLRFELDRFTRPVKPAVSQDPQAESIGGFGKFDTETVVDPADRPLRHRALENGSGLNEVVGDFDAAEIKGVARQDGAQRAVVIVKEDASWNGGKIVWHRGTSSLKALKGSLSGQFDQPWHVRLPEEWMRPLLGEFDWSIVQDRHDESVKPANVFIKRHKGAWIFTGHKPNTSARFWVKTEDGAPMYIESETPIVNGYGGESFGKTFNHAVYAFVKMGDGVARAKILPVPHGKRFRFSLTDLVDADVTIYPDPSFIEDNSLEIRPAIYTDDRVAFKVDKTKKAAIITGYTGTLYIDW